VTGYRRCPCRDKYGAQVQIIQLLAREADKTNGECPLPSFSEGFHPVIWFSVRQNTESMRLGVLQLRTSLNKLVQRGTRIGFSLWAESLILIIVESLILIIFKYWETTSPLPGGISGSTADIPPSISWASLWAWP